MTTDFATLQGLTIPEGVVTQITDAAGNVLWSAVKDCTIAINQSTNPQSERIYVTINGQKYYGNTAQTVIVPKGTTINCYVGSGPVSYQGMGGGIKVVGADNSETWHDNDGDEITFDYEVINDISIDLSWTAGIMYGGLLTITEQ